MRIRKKQCSSLLVLAVLLFASSFILAPRALALTPQAQGSSITTSPVTVDIDIQPGASQTTTLQMENNGTQPVPISVQLQTFVANGDDGEAAIIKPPASDPSPSWVRFSETNFVAEPGVWTPIKMTISLPPTASLGYYYAVILKPQLTIKNVNPDSSTVIASNAILVLVDTHSSNEVRQLKVTSYTANHKLYEYLPSNFSVTVHNSGNIFVPPQGSIYISRSKSFKSIIATLNINPTGGRVLPDSNRTYNAAWSSGFPVFKPVTVAGQPITKKNGQTEMHLSWNFANANEFRFGRYYAQLALVYNNGTRDIPIYGVVSFWVIPWKLILIILFVLAIQISLLLGFLRYRRMYRKSRTKSVQKKQEE